MAETKTKKRKITILIVAAIVVVVVGYQSITNYNLRLEVNRLGSENNWLRTELGRIK